MAFRIVPIVEGHGEFSAVPELLRRVILELNLGVPVVARPIRQARGSLLKHGGIENAVGLASYEMGESGAILNFWTAMAIAQRPLARDSYNERGRHERINESR